MAVVLLVADSVGIGALPDAGAYNDLKANTLANTARAVGGLNLPVLQSFGLGNINTIEGVSPTKRPIAAHGRMAEVAPGKDTTTGHWEMMGLILKDPFPVFPNGFPQKVIYSLENAIGRSIIGNKQASGTAIIDELGAIHMATGSPIVYTSADSVFQIAAHEDIIPLKELYFICEQARALLNGPYAVGRVIARPFVGSPGRFNRTVARRDYSLLPPSPTILDIALHNGKSILGVGKIGDIFAGRGLSEVQHSQNNDHGMLLTSKAVSTMKWDFIFTNLVDFDSLYGHRNDPWGYAAALERFDQNLNNLIKVLDARDVLMITADHGCDPTTPGTDHSREYVPVLVYGANIKPKELGTRETFADLGATVADILNIDWTGPGTSFLAEIDLAR